MLNGVVTFVNVSDPYAIPSSPEADETASGDIHLVHESEGASLGPNEAQGTDSTQAHTHGLETLSAAALCTPSASTFQEPTTYSVDALDYLEPMHTNHETLTPSLPKSLDHILNPTSTSPPTIDPDLQIYDVNEHLPGLFRGYNTARGSNLKASTETDHKTAFLLRHFSEVTGRWYVHRFPRRSHSVLCC